MNEFKFISVETRTQILIGLELVSNGGREKCQAHVKLADVSIGHDPFPIHSQQFAKICNSKNVKFVALMRLIDKATVLS